MVRSYYVFTNVLEKTRYNEIVDHENLKAVKIKLNISENVRSGNTEPSNGYIINRFTNRKDAENFLASPIIGKSIWIGNTRDYLGNIKHTYRLDIGNIISKNNMVDIIKTKYEMISLRNPINIRVLLTYRDRNLHKSVKTYNITLEYSLNNIINELLNNKNIEFIQDNDTTKDYETENLFLDYTELAIIYTADAEVGMKTPNVHEIILDKVIVEVVEPLQNNIYNKYNCLENILCFCFNYDKQITRTIKKIIKEMQTIDQTDDSFKVILKESDITKLEKSLGKNFDFIVDYETKDKALYCYDSGKKNAIKFLLKDQHIYLIKSVREKDIQVTPLINFENPPIKFIFYDYETVYSCKNKLHIPTCIYSACSDVDEIEGDKKFKPLLKSFEGEFCTKEMLYYYENLLPHNTRLYVGYNSSKFDIFFILNQLYEENRDVKVSIYKDKIYVVSYYNIFLDLLPLLPMGSLDDNCKEFKTLYQKKIDEVSFNEHNMIFNDPDHANGSIKRYFELIKSITNDKNSNETLYETLIKYCKYDVLATASLYKTYQKHIYDLIKLDNNEKIKLRNFKTLGELSMSLLLTIQEKSKTIIRKNKDTLYKYFAVIETEIVSESSNMYKECRQALIASISYAKKNTFINNETMVLLDVVSLYPYVLTGNFKYGYGKLKHVIVDQTYTTYHDLPLGIYQVEIIFTKKKFQRIPYSKKEESYEWIHDQKINRWLYAQDIMNVLSSGDVSVKIIRGYEFEKVGLASEIFGEYMSLFTDVKNYQDELKANSNPEYNQGLRATTKAFMNILSGKLVQVYAYDTNIKCFDKPLINVINDSDENVVDGPIIVEKNFTITRINKNFNRRKKIIDISLVGAQLYCHSREHMFKMIDKVYEYGYEPYVIETDSIIVNRDFLLHDITVRPEIYSGTMFNNIYKHKLKQFGQFDVENDYINELYIYSKKSYYFSQENGHKKYRFKGVSKKAIICPDNKTERYFKLYNKLKSYYEQQYKLNKLDANTKEQLAYANWLISKKLLSININKYLVSVNIKNIFKKLINKESVTIIQEIIKKNYVRNYNEQLSLENMIVIKSFNNNDQKYEVIKKDEFKKAYESLVNSLDN